MRHNLENNGNTMTFYLYTPIYTKDLSEHGFTLKRGRKFNSTFLFHKECAIGINAYIDEDENGEYIDTLNVTDECEGVFARLYEAFKPQLMDEFWFTMWNSLNEANKTESEYKRALDNSAYTARRLVENAMRKDV